DHHHCENHDDQLRAHLRRYVVDRCRHHARKRSERYAETVGKRDHEWHIDAEGAHQRRILCSCAEISAKPRALDDKPGPNTDTKRGRDDPCAIIWQEHESKILATAQRLRNRIRKAGRAEIIARNAFENQRESKSEQKPIEMVELIQPLQEQTLNDDASNAD